MSPDRKLIAMTGLCLLLAVNGAALARKVDLEALEAQLEQLKREEAAANAAAARKEAARKEAARLAATPFEQVAEGILDNKQGVIWATSDNGSDIDWNGATSWCASKGEGWSLPTVVQAQGLYDASGKYAQARSNQYGDWKIKPATDLIQFSEGPGWLWTSERDGSSSAFFVALGNGSRPSLPVSHSNDLRALCVRRRS